MSHDIDIDEAKRAALRLSTRLFKLGLGDQHDQPVNLGICRADKVFYLFLTCNDSADLATRIYCVEEIMEMIIFHRQKHENYPFKEKTDKPMAHWLRSYFDLSPSKNLADEMALDKIADHFSTNDWANKITMMAGERLASLLGQNLDCTRPDNQMAALPLLQAATQSASALWLLTSESPSAIVGGVCNETGKNLRQPNIKAQGALDRSEAIKKNSQQKIPRLSPGEIQKIIAANKWRRAIKFRK